MKGYSPTRIETATSNKTGLSLELGMVEKCNCKECVSKGCKCNCHK